MRRSARRLLVPASLVVAGAAAVALAGLAVDGRLQTDSVFALAGTAIFTIVGALIEDRRPGNRIGRISLATGVGLLASAVLRLAAVTVDDQPGSLPPHGAMLAVLSTSIFAASLVGGSLSLITNYPTGPVPGRPGRVLAWLPPVAVAVSIAQTFRPGPLQFGWIEAARNPLGVEAAAVAFEVGAGVLFFIYVIGMVLGAVSLGWRYRRADPVVRAQLRWFMAAAVVPIVLFVAMMTATESANAWVWDAWLLSFLLVPIAIGIGILRYRLFDIDHIVSRTLSYGLVTALLAGMFVAVNLALGTLVANVTGGSTIAVAASTLAAAALFQPLRRAVQTPIDSRFNRARVDAEEVIGLFGEQIRDEVDLGRLVAGMQSAAMRAMRPDVAGLWLRSDMP